MRRFFLLTLMFSLFSTFNLTAHAAEKAADTVYVQIATSQGDILLELDNKKAPLSVKNFLSYIKTGHYDGTIFHRVIRDFMIQGGGFDQNMIKKATQAPIKNEADNGLLNQRGTIAMARTSVVDSATSQFFINVKNNTFLNHGARDFGYAVFGKVIKGMKVVDGIATTATGLRDVPVEPIIINKMTVISAEQALAAE